MSGRIKQTYVRQKRIFESLTSLVIECHQFFDQKMDENQRQIRSLSVAYSRINVLKHVLDMYMPTRNVYHNEQRLIALFERVSEFLDRFKSIKFSPPGAIKPRDRIIILTHEPKFKPQFITPDKHIFIDVRYLLWIHNIKQELFSCCPNNSNNYIDLAPDFS